MSGEEKTFFGYDGSFTGRVTEQGLVDAAPYGASVVDGKLFFKLLDGSTIVCTCLGEPFVSKIVEACRHER